MFLTDGLGLSNDSHRSAPENDMHNEVCAHFSGLFFGCSNESETPNRLRAPALEIVQDPAE